MNRRQWWRYWFLFALSDRAFERWDNPPNIIYPKGDHGKDSTEQQRGT